MSISYIATICVLCYQKARKKHPNSMAGLATIEIEIVDGNIKYTCRECGVEHTIEMRDGKRYFDPRHS